MEYIKAEMIVELFGDENILTTSAQEMAANEVFNKAANDPHQVLNVDVSEYFN